MKIISEQLLQSIIEDRINKYKDYYWVFFDTETSGLKAEEDQLLEVAAIAVDADFYNSDQPAVAGQYHTKARLEQDTKAKIKAPHIPQRKGDLSKVDLLKMTRYGVPKDKFQDMKFDKEARVVKGFSEFLDNLAKTKPVLLVAHNADFDVGYMKEKARKYGLSNFEYEYIDTLKIVKEVFYPLLKVAQSKDLLGIFDRLKSQTHPFVLKKGDITARLGHIADALDVKAEGWHSAIFDIKMLIQVTRKIVNLLITNSGQEMNTTKITEERLKLIIKEELEKLLEEGILSKLAKGKIAGTALTAANIIRAGELATEPTRANKELTITSSPSRQSPSRKKPSKIKISKKAEV
jgi:DNA polymerase III epsilon subunit-like protein